jgi:hypothetical protein
MVPRRVALGLAALAVAGALLSSCGDDGGDGGGGEATELPAQSQTTANLTIGTATAALGAEAAVELKAEGVGEPGLGAWTLEVTYDNQYVSVAGCEEDSGTVCNPNSDDHTVRLAGAAGVGHVGDVLLATITFACDAVGVSPLAITVEVLADGTIGGPLDITPTIGEGSVTCT